jgi:hypothetical protein
MGADVLVEAGGIAVEMGADPVEACVQVA